jgi:hypothetical protein
VFNMLCDSDFWNRQIDEQGGKYLHQRWVQLVRYGSDPPENKSTRSSQRCPLSPPRLRPIARPPALACSKSRHRPSPSTRHPNNSTSLCAPSQN